MASLARRLSVLTLKSPPSRGTLVPTVMSKKMSRGYKTTDTRKAERHVETTINDIDFLRKRQGGGVDIGSTEIPVIPMFVPGTYAQFYMPAAGTGLHRARKWFTTLFQDYVTSLQQVWTLVKYQGWPPGHPIRSTSKLLSSLSFSSTREKAWISPIRKDVLEAYKALNTAIASRDKRTISQYARGDFLDLALARAPSTKHIWTLHKEVRPVECVSIRAHAYLKAAECNHGMNGFLIQAIFRFDTMQSLSLPGSKEAPQQERVIEYLVFEKRNWLKHWPWAVVKQGTPGRWIGGSQQLDSLYEQLAR